MTRGVPPACDRCGSACGQLGDAAIVLTFDPRDVLVAAAFTHRACAPAAAEPGSRVELIVGGHLVRRRTFEKLSRLARLHGASISRVRRRAGFFAPLLRRE